MIILEWTLSILFAWFYVALVHEIWHIVMLPSYNLKLAGLYPFWHWKSKVSPEWRVWRPWELFKDPFGGHGKFYFARYQHKTEFPIPHLLHGSHNFIDIAPLVGDCIRLIIVITIGLVFGFFPLLGALVAASIIDAVVWLYGFFFGSPSCDGKRFRFGR